jgi:glycosyltransferase involved in cell wall biosynthesis
MLKNPSKKKPLVSIILNCYNGEKYLQESLKSIENQTYKQWELIFWDNKSTDNSKKIFQSYLNKNFKYFNSQKHTSLYAARNLAIEKAKGQFIAFIDSDDTWNKDKLKIQMKCFTDKEVGVVYGNLWLRKESFNKKKKHINYKIPEGYIHSNLINNYYVGILSSVIRKTCLGKSKKIFNDKYNIIGDYDLFLRLSKMYKFKAIQEPIATYRLHDSNLSNLNKKNEVLEFMDWLKKNKKTLKKEDYKKIKKKIMILKFISLKFEENFLKTFKFFLSSINSLSGVKNILILILPRFILKRFMWFL